MRVALVISSLDAGGAERVAANMANYWAAKDWKVTLITFDDGSMSPFYRLIPEVDQISLNLLHTSPNPGAGLLWNIKRVLCLQKAFNKIRIDGVISFMDMTNILTVLAMGRRLKKIPLIMTEHTDPTRHPIGNIWQYLRRRIYPYARYLVVLNDQVKGYYSPIMGNRVRVIPNPVIRPTYTQSYNMIQKPGRRIMMALGRLSHEKGMDLLIEAFLQVKDKCSDWDLYIIGWGPLAESLRNQVDQSGLSQRVQFLGRLNNPYDYLKQADLFVLPSRYEGFPNALCEAMACALPVIATDCSQSIGEIIRPSIDGIIVPRENVPVLAGAIQNMMFDQESRQKMGEQAVKVVERYSLDMVMGQWEQLIKDISGVLRHD